MMKDGTYIVKMGNDGIPILDKEIVSDSGYWVADESGVSVHGTLDRNSMNNALSLMDIQDGEIVGIWENDSVSYIDRAYHVDDKIEALEMAKKYSQLAIWDCEKAEAVFI